MALPSRCLVKSPVNLILQARGVNAFIITEMSNALRQFVEISATDACYAFLSGINRSVGAIVNSHRLNPQQYRFLRKMISKRLA